MIKRDRLKVIISGGGTGGHIFPAIAIAKAIQKHNPTTEILFVGAEGKMEMEKVPAEGFTIVGLPIVGIQRRLTWKNLMVPWKLWKSMQKAKALIREFQPDIAIGVGGYASGPLLRAAAAAGIKTLIQEQNSYPGITNKLLSAKANAICVAYEGLDKFFPASKIVLTGNPVRAEVVNVAGKRQEAIDYFGLDESKRTILVIGGSLGARTINEAIQNEAERLIKSGVQVLWQTGKTYFQMGKDFADGLSNIHVHAFIQRMDLAYAAADIIVSRAGAMSISELCLVKKPVIFVPSPNVSEDHQTKNAMALVKHQAAVLVPDIEAREKLGAAIDELLNKPEKMNQLATNISKLGIADATDRIVAEINRLL